MGAIEIILGLAGVVGLALVVLGLRGRRDGDHPHCRNCAFDLYGLADDSETCAECGRDITQPGATVVGEKVRRVRMLGFGAVVLVVATLLGGAVAWHRTDAVTIYANLPASLLPLFINDAKAREELSDRLFNRRLSDGTINTVVDRTLEQQADKNRPWDASWGVLFEDAYLAGKVRDEQLDQYLSNGFQFELALRDRVQIGRQPVCYISATSQNRLGANTKIRVTARLISLSADGREIELDKYAKYLKQNAANFTVTLKGISGSHSHLSIGDVGDKIKRVTIEGEFDAVMTATVGTLTIDREVTRLPQTVAAAIDVVAEPTGDYSIEATAEERSEKASVWIDGQASAPEKTQLAFRVVDHPETQVGLNAWLRVGEQYFSLRNYFSSFGHSSDRNGMETSTIRWWLKRAIDEHPALKRQTHVDLIVRPNFEQAETGVQPQPTWLGEWIVADIPLHATPRRETNARGVEESIAPVKARLLSLDNIDDYDHPK